MIFLSCLGKTSRRLGAIAILIGSTSLALLAQGRDPAQITPPGSARTEAWQTGVIKPANLVIHPQFRWVRSQPLTVAGLHEPKDPPRNMRRGPICRLGIFSRNAGASVRCISF